MKLRELSLEEVEGAVGGCGNWLCVAWRWISHTGTADWFREKLEEMSKTGGSSEPAPVLYDGSSGWYDRPNQNGQGRGGGGSMETHDR